MNCAFDKEKLTGYYDGELEAAEKAEVERHIASCSECLRELGELKSAAILVKELPRLRAPRSVAEGVAREMQAAGKVHSFARMRRTILWGSAAAAALFIGLNIMYFSAADRSPSAPAMARTPAPVTVVGKIQQAEELQNNAAPPKEAGAERRALADRAAAADEGKLRENRKQVPELKEQEKADVAKKVEAMPAERARDKAGDGLAKGAAEPTAPPKPTAAPPGAAAPAPAPAPVAKPAPEAAEKSATKKDAVESLTRAEADLKSKRGAAADPVVAAEAPPTHLTLASTQIAKARPQVEEALRKMGVALPPPAPPPAKMMKAPAARETETTIALDLTDAQIARLRQELDKPGSSRLLAAAPGDPVLAEFRDGRVFGRKEPSGVASGGGAQAGKSRELGKADPKPEAKAEAPKDARESKDLDAAPADKAPEARRRVILHLIEVPYVPDTQPAPDSLKK